MLGVMRACTRGTSSPSTSASQSSLAPARIGPAPRRSDRSGALTCGERARLLVVRARPGGGGGGPAFLEIDEYGSNLWELDAIADIIRKGGVGILPTDTHPAIVCDLMNREATEELYRIRGIKSMESRKRLSILCRGLGDVDEYTLGWPAANDAGQTSVFKVVRKVLPGPYTFILHTSKSIPKIVTDSGSKKKSAKRSTVGIRLPDDSVCQYILEMLDAPLLCASAHVEEEPDILVEIPDAATMADNYPGIDFVVDVGMRIAQPSTVIDMSTAEPELVRQGLGDASFFGL